MNENGNIQIFFNEIKPDADADETLNSNSEDIINDILQSLEKEDLCTISYNYLFSESYYNELTLKDLIKICQFYSLDKGTKGYKKSDYINLILAFESTPENYEYIEKRQRFWTYMIELKNDPIMKKYVLWD